MAEDSDIRLRPESTGVKQKDAERLKALAELQKKKASYTGKDQSIGSRIGRLRGELMKTCDVKIREAETFFRNKLTWLREPGRISSQHVGLIGRDIVNDTVKGRIESNHGAVNRAMVYCQECLKKLEQMKQAPEVDCGMIDKLKGGFPSIDTYSSVEETRVLPGSKVPDPLMGLVSDSQMDWEMGKIMKKARKILKRCDCMAGVPVRDAGLFCVLKRVSWTQSRLFNKKGLPPI